MKAWVFEFDVPQIARKNILKFVPMYDFENQKESLHNPHSSTFINEIHPSSAAQNHRDH